MPASAISRSSPATAGASLILRLGRWIAFAGVVLPLLLIGGLKFTAIEAEALKPFISGTPWLSWLYPVFGEAGASYFLGVVEITAASALLAAPWLPRAGIVGAGLATSIFLVTCSLLLSMPIWEPAAGGFPALSGVGQFLIKDIALLGIALALLAESLAADHSRSGTPMPEPDKRELMS